MKQRNLQKTSYESADDPSTSTSTSTSTFTILTREEALKAWQSVLLNNDESSLLALYQSSSFALSAWQMLADKLAAAGEIDSLMLLIEKRYSIELEIDWREPVGAHYEAVINSVSKENLTKLLDHSVFPLEICEGGFEQFIEEGSIGLDELDTLASVLSDHHFENEYEELKNFAEDYIPELIAEKRSRMKEEEADEQAQAENCTELEREFEAADPKSVPIAQGRHLIIRIDALNHPSIDKKFWEKAKFLNTVRDYEGFASLRTNFNLDEAEKLLVKAGLKRGIDFCSTGKPASWLKVFVSPDNEMKVLLLKEAA